MNVGWAWISILKYDMLFSSLQHHSDYHQLLLPRPQETISLTTTGYHHKPMETTITLTIEKHHSNYH
jgi:hypothetical protein